MVQKKWEQWQKLKVTVWVDSSDEGQHQHSVFVRVDGNLKPYTPIQGV
jgi:hypothetical protein